MCATPTLFCIGLTITITPTVRENLALPPVELPYRFYLLVVMTVFSQ
jgi:hypothetical protein